MEILFTLIVCHAIGDYVLQSDYLAQNKGKDNYLLLIHCILYCCPFIIVFGYTWQLALIFLVHIIVDVAKAKYNKINIVTDQTIHYLALLPYLFTEM